MTEKFHQNDKTSFQKEVKKYYTPKNEKKLFFKPSVSLSDDDDDDIVHPVSMSPNPHSTSKCQQRSVNGTQALGWAV